MTGDCRKAALLLLSRQSKRPSRRDDWVTNSIRAVTWVKQNGMTLLSSTGMQTWELITSLGSINGIPLKLILPVQAEEEFHAARKDAIDQFELDPSLIEFHPISEQGRITDRAGLMQSRDKTIVDMADLILPISLRPQGNMFSLMSEARGRGMDVNELFFMEYQKQKNEHSFRITSESVNPEIDNIDGEYLIHWTRAVSDKWPNEKLIDYYRAIASSDSYPRNGCDTLQRIVESGHILASARNMPGKVPTVSFSGMNPRQLIPMIKWRARYHQMSFEPYGIGVSRDLVETLQIKQVNYFQDKADLIGSTSPPWLNQSVGKVTDWRPEQEYRHRDDFNLKDIPRDQMILFCRFVAEAKELEGRFGIRTIPFEIR